MGVNRRELNQVLGKVRNSFSTNATCLVALVRMGDKFVIVEIRIKL